MPEEGGGVEQSREEAMGKEEEIKGTFKGGCGSGVEGGNGKEEGEGGAGGGAVGINATACLHPNDIAEGYSSFLG